MTRAQLDKKMSEEQVKAEREKLQSEATSNVFERVPSHQVRVSQTRETVAFSQSGRGHDLVRGI